MEVISRNPNPPLPSLAPPGAGLPIPELWIARFLFQWTRTLRSRQKVTSVIQKECERVLGLVRPISAESAARRVLIKRLPGLEDSSRFWSAWMTLDHLRIVNTGIAGIIKSLGEDRLPGRVVGTADVKPSSQADAAAVPSFQQSCDRVLLDAQQVAQLKTRLRHPHPWFGPLDAAGWYAVAGFHLTLHRTQVERIIAAL